MSFLEIFKLTPNAGREGLFSHARIVSNSILSLFLMLGLAAQLNASADNSAFLSVALSTSAAQAQTFLQQAKAEFDAQKYWSAWRDSNNAIHMGYKTPEAYQLRARAYGKIQEKTTNISSGTIKTLSENPPLTKREANGESAKPTAKKHSSKIVPAPAEARTNEINIPSIHAILHTLTIAALVLGFLVLIFFVVTISKATSPQKARRDPGMGHVKAEDVPAPAPLPKPGAVLGGQFVLGRLMDETDGVCIYEGRDLNDESVTIARYPAIPGGITHARKALDLKHPAIAHLRGVFPYGVHIFAVYEPLRGDSLRRLLERLPERRYSPEQALRLLKHLCEALECAHALGVCHGPLVPGEIIIGPSQVKVRGFGLWPLAALAYAAPEFSPETGTLTPNSDIFSLSACLYEMLTGKTTFFESRDEKGPNLFVPPSRHVRELGHVMDDFFAKALSADPKKRFSSATELFSSFSNLVVSKAGPSKDKKSIL